MTASLLAITNALLAQVADPTPITTGGDFWFPSAKSTVAEGLDQMFHFINYLCYFFFALITILMVIFVVKYRAPKGHAFRTDGPTHHLPMELTWLVIPLILVVVIFWLGFAGSRQLKVEGYVGLTTMPSNAYEIQAIARQWSWNFKYPNGVVTDNLYIPAGEPVKMVLRAEDVLHAFFVPNFRVKRDCVPERYGYLWFQADEPTGHGEYYNLFCAEYCGNGHSQMNRKVFVLSRPDFDAWLKKEEIWITEVAPEDLYWVAGPKLFARCSSCHTIDGTVGVGPSWKGLWDRVTGGAGSDGKFADGKTYAEIIGPGKEFETPENYISNSIIDPNNHVVAPFRPGQMPTFKGQLGPVEIEALIQFMRHLDEFDPKTYKLKVPKTPAAKPAGDTAAAAPASTSGTKTEQKKP